MNQKEPAAIEKLRWRRVRHSDRRILFELAPTQEGPWQVYFNMPCHCGVTGHDCE